MRQISPFSFLLQTYSPNGAVLKEFPPWCCFVRGLHGFCMENASFNGEFVSTGHVDGNPLLLLAISGWGASRRWSWRFRACAEIAALTGDFQGYERRVKRHRSHRSHFRGSERSCSCRESPTGPATWWVPETANRNCGLLCLNPPLSPVDHHAEKKKRQEERELFVCVRGSAEKKKEERGCLLLLVCLRAFS